MTYLIPSSAVVCYDESHLNGDSCRLWATETTLLEAK